MNLSDLFEKPELSTLSFVGRQLDHLGSESRAGKCGELKSQEKLKGR